MITFAMILATAGVFGLGAAAAAISMWISSGTDIVEREEPQ